MNAPFMKTPKTPTSAAILVLAMISFSCSQHKGFEINGNITGLADSTKVILSDPVSGQALDSMYVMQHRFYFQGTLEEEPQLLYLLFSNKDDTKHTSLFMGNEAVEVKGERSDLPEKLTVTGSEHHKYKSKLDQLTADLNIARNAHLSNMFSLRQSGHWNDSLQKAYWGGNGHITQIDKKTGEITNRFLSENLNAYYTLSQVVVNKTELSRDTLQAMYGRLLPKYKNSKYGKVLATFLNTPPLELHHRFYDFQAQDQNGTPRKLSDFMGEKYVLLDFSSVSCSWCRKALPLQKQIAEKLDDRLQPITFYVDKNREDWVKYTHQEQISWPSLWHPEGRYSDAYTKYGIIATPSYFLLDRQGVVIGKWEGYQENLEEEIRKLLQP
jgi:peroxiredoxin